MDAGLIAFVGKDEIAKLSNYKSLRKVIHKRFDGKYPNQTLLHTAVDRNAHRCLRFLVEHTHPQSDINAATAQGYTALYLAAEFGHVDCIAILLEHVGTARKLDLYATARGMSPLYAAAAAGNVTAVEMLLKVMDPKKIAFTDADGNPMLHKVIDGGHGDVLRLLVRVPGVDLNHQATPFLLTPLIFALNFLKEECVKILLEQESTDVNRTEAVGAFPLVMAISHNLHASFHLLVAHKRIDVARVLPAAIMDDECRGRLPPAPTILQYAISRKDTHWAVGALLKHPDIKVGMPVLGSRSELWLAIKERWIDIGAKLCAVPSVDVNQIDDRGNTPLHACAVGGLDRIVGALLARHDLDVNHRSVDGMTALHMAVKVCDAHPVGMTMLLRDARIDVNVDGAPILIHAVNTGDVQIVRRLLSMPATQVDVNATNANGFTPLIVASCLGHIDIVAALLKCQLLDAKMTNVYGKTALYHAKNATIATLIEAHMAERAD